LTTLLEELPVRETLDAVEELDGADLRPGAVLVNQVRPVRLPAAALGPAAGGTVDGAALGQTLRAAGLDLDPATLDGLLDETVDHAVRAEVERSAAAQLAEVGMPVLELPLLADGIDTGALYELADLLRTQG